MFNNFVKMISRVHIWIKQNITKKGSKEASIELQKNFIKTYDIEDYKDVQSFIKEKMTYKYDALRGQVDILHDVDKIYQNKFKGDCDEYSILQHRILTELGYESYVVSYVQKNIVNSHSICMFKLENGKIQSISTEGLRTGFVTVDEWLDSYENWLGGYSNVIFKHGRDLKNTRKKDI